MVNAYLQRDEKTDAADAVVMHVGEATDAGTVPLDRLIAQLAIERGADLGGPHDVVTTRHRGTLEMVAAKRSDLGLSDDALIVEALHSMFGLTPDSGGLGGWTAVLLPPYDLTAYHAEMSLAVTRATSTLSTASPVPVIEEE